MVNKGKMNTRKSKARETKIKIYQSAKQLFTKYSFDTVSVDSIVEMAGVSKGSFYVHFDSKNSLIAALISDFVGELDLDYKSFLESLPANTMASDMLLYLMAKISDIISCTIGYEHMKFIYEAQLTRTINTNAVMSYNRDLYKIFNIIISKGIELGEFKTELSSDIISKHCIMAIRGLTYEWCIRYPDFDLKDEAQKHFKILLTGIKS